MSDYIIQSMESTNNSPLATEQGVAKATALIHNVIKKRPEREQRAKQNDHKLAYSITIRAFS